MPLQYQDYVDRQKAVVAVAAAEHHEKIDRWLETSTLPAAYLLPGIALDVAFQLRTDYQKAGWGVRYKDCDEALVFDKPDIPTSPSDWGNWK